MHDAVFELFFLRRVLKTHSLSLGPSGKIYRMLPFTRFLFLTTIFLASFTSALAEPTTNEAISFNSKGLEDLFLPKRPLVKLKLGVNAFANDPRFGSIRSQYNEVLTTLGIKQIRMLFAWTDQVQPSPAASPFFGFYDELANSLPAGAEVIVVLTAIPSWMKNSQNWTGGSPGSTFVEKWVKPVVTRYRKNPQIKAFQLWNEPNDLNNPENHTMGFANSPDTFVEFMAKGSNAMEEINTRKLVVNGATTAIAQNFPDTLDYNKALVKAGILSVIDIFAIHFYGKNVVPMILPDGAGDFLKSLSKPVWVTESGAQGVLKQKEYAQRIFPYLLNNFPIIKRIYIYQFTESAPASSSYGLRTLDRKNPVSDLYVYLRSLR